MKTYTYSGDEGTFEYKVINRPMRKIKMVVREGMAVVSAPRNTNMTLIHEFVAKNADWVIMQREKRIEEKEKIADGEEISVLGVKRRITVSSGRTHVLMGEKDLFVTVADPSDKTLVVAAVDRFLYDLAKKEYADSLDKLLEKARGMGLDFQFPQIFIRKMTSRWGSCTSADGTIRMNAYLVRLDRKYIDYVMAHELCHLKEANHGAAFYNLLLRIMPDCMTRRRYLKSIDVLNYTY